MAANSIGIIGMGWVGSSVAISILQKGVTRELLLNDVRNEIAEGEAMDLNHGSSFYPTAKIRACSIPEMKKCDAVVITAGRGGSPDESRLDLLQSNIKIVKSISEQLEGFKGILIIVANPVDVLTYYYQYFTGLPKERVIGTGTLLDTARLRDYTGKKLNIDPRSIHANVIGEHGDSEVVLWSRATIGGIPIRNWKTWHPDLEDEIATQVRTAAYEIIRRKGATNHAIGLVTASLLKWIMRGERRMVNICSAINGPHGLAEVALSLPTIISDQGVEEVLEMSMDEQEKQKLLKSAHILSEAINSVK
jgi:L-lactate dehydrogenase